MPLFVCDNPETILFGVTAESFNRPTLVLTLSMRVTFGHLHCGMTQNFHDGKGIHTRIGSFFVDMRERGLIICGPL